MNEQDDCTITQSFIMQFGFWIWIVAVPGSSKLHIRTDGICCSPTPAAPSCCTIIPARRYLAIYTFFVFSSFPSQREAEEFERIIYLPYTKIHAWITIQ